MRTGKIEANLNVLNDEFHLPFLPDLIARKTGGGEHDCLDSGELSFFEVKFTELEAELRQAGQDTSLPAEPTGKDALSDLLNRIRMNTIPARNARTEIWDP